MSKLDKLVTLIPMNEIEVAAQQQIFEVLDKPWVKKMAIMPDVHAGYSMPIGGVALCDKIISPAYVGYDIGCGMCAVKLEHDLDVYGLTSMDSRWAMLDKIESTIAMGVGQGNEVGEFFPIYNNALGDKDFTQKINTVAQNQFGSLGSGNHFIEIGTNGTNASVTVHCGSRGPGYKICEYYMHYGTEFSINSEIGKAYNSDMTWAASWALLNRRYILATMLDLLGVSKEDKRVYMDDLMINEHHNYAVVYDDGTILHRKGATPAEKDQLGIIPGSMGTGVYITSGLGNKNYLCSASHGAGRCMSRGEAKRTLSEDEFAITMKGIAARVTKKTIDESPMAYKDINHGLELQEGKVIKVVDHFKPVVVAKG